ncbi:MAG: hypothetical protein IJ094_11985 [Bacilli bacterium]|nr:hypothetical protein [Bacilli bacterium]
MARYFINKNAQSNGDHEIHKSSCIHYYLFKTGNNFEELGVFLSDAEAIVYAKNKYPYWIIDGCYHCCPSIHNR